MYRAFVSPGLVKKWRKVYSLYCRSNQPVLQPTVRPNYKNDPAKDIYESPFLESHETRKYTA